MGKKNKIRYVAETKKRVEIFPTGNVYLQHRDEELVAQTIKGDLLVFPECVALNTNHLGEYTRTGFVGYFRVDVFDGVDWQPVILNEIFRDREHHFSKTERSIDRFNFILEMLQALKGRTLLRTYREHYELEE
jgi:hypothetical protein